MKSRIDAGVDALFFGPHPDDVELFCGGTVARLVARGHTVALVDLTRGERASRGTVDVRARESDEAARILGVAARENLALKDGGLRAHAEGDDEDPASPVLRIADVLRRARPRVVVLPYPRERHADHEAASALVTRALTLARLAKVTTTSGASAHEVRTVLLYPQRVLAEPSFVTDVSDVYERKLAAIRAHASQVSEDAQNGTLVGSPGALDALVARDTFYGAQIGVARAEPFVSRARLSVDDPLAFFDEGARGRAFFFPDIA